MKWYDFFSNFYDKALNQLYYDSRVKAIEYLRLDRKMNVLDIACGTGANFIHMISKEENINIYGTDYSPGMLEKAQSTIEKNNWKNVYLFQSDARDLNSELIEQKTNKIIEFDRIICSLGFSVLPDWTRILDNALTLLKKDGRIVIMDVFAEKRNINSWFVEQFANADLNRKIWQQLKLCTDNFEFEYLPVNKYLVGGSMFVATGTKQYNKPNRE